MYAELEEDNAHIALKAEFRYRDLIKSIPGSSWSVKDNIWRIPVSWSSCLALRTEFREDLEIGPRLSQWAFHELETRINPANAWKDVEATEIGDTDLFPHQRAGVQFLVAAKQAILADSPGLGKSAQVIRALQTLQAQGTEVFPALVAVPNSLKRNWEREFHKWAPTINVQVINGSATQRRKQFDALINPKDDEPVPDVIVINYESLRAHSRLAPYGSIAITKCIECGGHDESVTVTRCQYHQRELNQIEFKAVIADEAHRIRNGSGQAVRALWAATGDAPIRFAMTGTPIGNNAVDLWAILHWLNPKEWPSKVKWIDRLIDTMSNDFGGLLVIGIKPQKIDEFHAALSPRMRRMLKAKVLPWLPPMIFERRDIEMSAKQQRAYNQMRDHMIAELESGEYLTAPSVLTQTMRLLQFASSYATLEVDADGETHALLAEPSCKIDALMDDFANEDFGDDSVAVCAVSKQLINLLSKRLTKAGIPHGLITGDQSVDIRQASIDDFQSGKIKWILYTVQAGGVGITLTAARRLIRLQRSWSLIDDQQALDRVHRIGSEIHDSVIITDYVVADSVEERVLQVLESKGESLEEVVQDQKKLLSILKADAAKK